MSFVSINFRFAAIALFAMSAAVGVAQTTGAQPPAAKSAAADAKSKAPDAKSRAETDSQKLKEQVDAQRQKMLDEYNELQKQLKNATEEKRKEILAKLDEKQKAFAETRAALAQQIQEDMRRRRTGSKR